MAGGWDRVMHYPRVKSLRATCQFEAPIAGRTELEASLRGVVAHPTARHVERRYRFEVA